MKRDFFLCSVILFLHYVYFISTTVTEIKDLTLTTMRIDDVIAEINSTYVLTYSNLTDNFATLQISSELLAKDKLCRTTFPRCFYCTQQSDCVWCAQTKTCRHEPTLLAENKLRTLWAAASWNTSGLDLADKLEADYALTKSCGICNYGECIDDGCAIIYETEELLKFGVQPNSEFIETSTLSDSDNINWIPDNYTYNDTYIERSLFDSSDLWRIPEQIGYYIISLNIKNYVVDSSCTDIRRESDECPAPTKNTHNISDSSTNGLVGEVIAQPRRPTLDEYNTCYNYLSKKYASKKPYYPVLPTSSEGNQWIIKPIQNDLTHIPCCTLCCCSYRRFYRNDTLFFETYDDLIAGLRSDEFSVGVYSRFDGNFTVNVTRSYTATCPKNSSHLAEDHPCNVYPLLQDNYSVNLNSVVTGNSTICPELTCDGVHCDADFTCPYLECESSSFVCPVFQSCSGGANKLGGNPNIVEPITINNTYSDLFGRTVEETVILEVPTRSCPYFNPNDTLTDNILGVDFVALGDSGNNNTYLSGLFDSVCTTVFDFHNQTLGMTLYELFLEGYYWDDNFVEPLRLNEPSANETYPAPLISDTALSKMLFDDEEEGEFEYHDDLKEQMFQNKKVEFKAECPGIRVANASGACVCPIYWTGADCDIPVYDLNCEGQDRVLCAEIKTLIYNCGVVTDADEIDIDCVNEGYSVLECLESGLPFRDRDFDRYNTVNNSIWIRNSDNFAAKGDGWVVAFTDGKNVVSSGPVDCTCEDVGTRCFCSEGAYGNATSEIIPEQEYIISSNFETITDVFPSQQGTWDAGAIEVSSNGSTFLYNDARVDGSGDTPFMGPPLSEHGWKESIVLICNKCIGTPELMNKVCDQQFIDHCHRLEGMTGHPLCSICSPDFVQSSIVTSNMQENITEVSTPQYSTEKPLTDAEKEYRRDQWDTNALAYRSDILKKDVSCHLTEQKIPATTREDDLICHVPNDDCAGLLEAEKNNHPALNAPYVNGTTNKGYKNFGPLRCPHIRHCCMTSVDTELEATCSLEHTCGLSFLHPYIDCGYRATGCLPDLEMCIFDYDTVSGNPVCGKLDSSTNPWTKVHATNAAGCAAPSAVEAHTWKSEYTSNNPETEGECTKRWTDWCLGMDRGSPNSSYVPKEGFCDNMDYCKSYLTDPRYSITRAKCSYLYSHAE